MAESSAKLVPETTEVIEPVGGPETSHGEDVRELAR